MIDRLIEALWNFLRGLFEKALDSEQGRRVKPPNRRTVGPPDIMEVAAGEGPSWGTLSSLAAHPTDPHRLFAVTDHDSPPLRIVEISVANGAPRVVRQIGISAPGFTKLDCEGLAIVPGGGFWLASEGKAGSTRSNVLVEVNAEGRLLRSIELPPAIAARVTDRGFEGVAYAQDPGVADRLVVSFQSGIDGDAEGLTRIGVVDLSSRTWTFHYYPLELLESGNFTGLSDIVHLGANRFAVIERDGKGGKHAVKWITITDLGSAPDAGSTGEQPVLSKRLAIDLVPFFRERGYRVEKEIEGLASAADNRVYAITDNDNERPTLLLYLGQASVVFGS
ncbi:MAG: esterase-like activity of phytase family protein [Hyphomicrobiaceae bacterium]|nr:esterase-like activity of phytase family protein [Hyphomicrobiaceae bacterium]